MDVGSASATDERWNGTGATLAEGSGTTFLVSFKNAPVRGFLVIITRGRKYVLYSKLDKVSCSRGRLGCCIPQKKRNRGRGREQRHHLSPLILALSAVVAAGCAVPNRDGSNISRIGRMSVAD